jgi:sestrin 1/3
LNFFGFGHFQRLTKSKNSWSLAEVVHAITLLAHFHSLSSFVFSCGLTQELDNNTISPSHNNNTNKINNNNNNNNNDITSNKTQKINKTAVNGSPEVTKNIEGNNENFRFCNG